uniref:NLP1-9 GAF domain-containing protein n=1 Tax=Salix viminalis TaxID=40686 RepID=A0A6N2LTZ2_SALVM
MTTPESSKLLDSAIEDGDLNLADSLINDVLAGNDDKLVKYFVEALVRRVYKIYPKNPRPLVPSCTDLRCNMDYLFFPFFWFAETTTRGAIADALTGKKRIHVIDFSLMPTGKRWGFLLDDYVKQSGDAISFHLTTIGPILSKNGDYLNEILEKLPAEAKKLPIEFEVKHVAANTPAEIVEAALKLERSSQDETIVVRWEFELHKLLAQPGATESVLSKLKELKPEIMIVVEQEASLNGQDFWECFSSSIHYYSIVFYSLDKDNFNYSNHCKVLWEMYFRRQISNLVGQQSTDKIVRLKTFSEWRETLFHSGFHHVRLQTQRKGLDHLREYRLEERNRHPVLYRDGYPLLFTSAWKPDPTQPNSESSGSWNQESSLRAEATIPGGSSGPPILAGTVSSSSFLDDQPDDPHCFSINQIAASAEIFDMMEYICHVHYLPLALTWMSDSRVLHLEKSACYLNDLSMVEFMEACGKHHLEEGKGVAGKALQLNSMYFVSDISDTKQNNDVKGFPSIFVAWDFRLHGVVAIKLASVHISSINYVLEFFLPLEMKEISAQRLLVNQIVSILEKNYRNSWRVCNEELSRANIGSEVEVMAEEVGAITITPAAIPASQSPELSEIGSLNSSQLRYLCNNFNPPGDEVRVPETHDQKNPAPASPLSKSEPAHQGFPFLQLLIHRIPSFSLQNLILSLGFFRTETNRKVSRRLGFERKLSCFVYWVDKISGKREALMDLKVGFKCTSNMRGRIRSIKLLWKVL